MKRLQLLFHNLGLGDVIVFSPVILLALDSEFEVDLTYATCQIPDAIPLLLAKAMASGRLRAVKRGARPANPAAYDTAVVFSRWVLSDLLWRARAGDVLCIPVPERRRIQIWLYNHVLSRGLRLCGLRPRRMRANPGRSIGRMTFEAFAEYLGSSADFPSFVPRVRKLLPAPDPNSPHVVLVHLFRDEEYRRIRDSALERIAKSLARATPGREVHILFNPRSSFERISAERFAGFCATMNLSCRLLSGPPLEEIARRAAAASLYVGVDHGISQLAGLLCSRSLVVYGGLRHHNDVHLIWPPMMEAEPVERDRHVSVIRSGDRVAALVHPARGEYTAQRRPDSVLINRTASGENLLMALSLLGFPAAPNGFSNA